MSVLAIPAQLWTGYFGMNFEFFPLLRSEYGLPFFWAGVAASTAACAVWFRAAMRPDAPEPDALAAPGPRSLARRLSPPSPLSEAAALPRRRRRDSAGY